MDNRLRKLNGGLAASTDGHNGIVYPDGRPAAPPTISLEEVSRDVVRFFMTMPDATEALDRMRAWRDQEVEAGNEITDVQALNLRCAEAVVEMQGMARAIADEARALQAKKDENET